MSTQSTNFSEDALVEQPTIALFDELGYSTANCFDERFGTTNSTFGRETKSEVVLSSKLMAALKKLNPALAEDAYRQAVDQLTIDRSAMSMVNANHDVYKLLKDGVKVKFQDNDGNQAEETLRVIDWIAPLNNEFFLASQFWIAGSTYTRRTDLIGFVNGIPLIFIELKKAHSKVEHAYKNNLRDYKTTIPQLFWYNAFVILSNGSQSKIGSVSSGWEHFSDWKRINNEGETGVISLETLIRGTCDKSRFLDLVENFTVFDDSKGGLIKVVAKNHQYLGVNSAVSALYNIKKNQGKLGVFWHTQGSGKSLAMVFFSQKILRTIPGNWTFLVITDREDLDKQIYNNFRNTGVVTENCQARNGRHLQQLLKENHRFVFTLIQKFGHERPKDAPKGWKSSELYPMLSDRSDVIVITDEAHRSQYDDLALNMRNALPNAAFIGFTGTPLMAGEERTKATYGDYISIYNFRQSVEDGATVPLFYENRTPELQLTNENLQTDIEYVIDTADLDEDQQKKLEREFAREYHLITRDDRLEKVAEDLVAHFMGRGQGGKGMVISIDKLTAVKMFEKVKKYWGAYLAGVKSELLVADPLRRPELVERIAYMESMDMAVVMSQQQNEVDEFQKNGINIEPHRLRMVKEDLETKFKNPDDPFRLVFVCAMWLTGFDAPCVSTIYLDKPMKNHSLMQTIARANRVFGEKNNGLIVDYIGVFRDMQKALAIYGSSSGNGTNPGECPIETKEALVALLAEAMVEAEAFCKERGVDIQKVLDAEGFAKIAKLDDAATNLVEMQVIEAVADAAEQILVNDELKKKYLSHASKVVRLYKAILPDPKANDFAPKKTVLVVLAEKIRSFMEEASIEDVLKQVEDVLDQSIATTGYVIHQTETSMLIDLSKLDFDALRAHFEKGRQRTIAAMLQSLVGKKLEQMVNKNKARMELLAKFKKLIDEYNKGLDVHDFVKQIEDFIKLLNEEDKRGVVENLTEEELAVFDILAKPTPELTASEKEHVKQIARKLLQTLKESKLVLDWKKRFSTHAAVRVAVADILDELPRVYTPELYEEKAEAVFMHVFESYDGEGKSVYGAA